MIYCGTWCANIFIGEGFDNFAMFRFPAVEGGKGDPGAGFLVPQGFMVSAKTKHPAEAVGMGELPRLRRDGRQVRRSHGRHPLQRQADRHREGHRAVQVDRQRHRRRHRFGDGARRAARGFGLQRLPRCRRRDPQRHQDAAAGDGRHPRRWRSPPRPRSRVRWSSRPDRSAPRVSLARCGSFIRALCESDARRHRRQSRDVRRPAPGIAARCRAAQARP